MVTARPHMPVLMCWRSPFGTWLGAAVAGRHHQPLVVVGVPQHDPDAAVAEPAGEQLGRLGEQLLEIEDRGDLPGDLGDGRQPAAAAALGLHQPGVLDHDGELGGQRLQQDRVFRREVVQAVAVGLQHADQLVAALERDQDRRADAVILPGPAEARLGGDVRHDDRPPLGGGPAGDAALADPALHPEQALVVAVIPPVRGPHDEVTAPRRA